MIRGDEAELAFYTLEATSGGGPVQMKSPLTAAQAYSRTIGEPLTLKRSDAIESGKVTHVDEEDLRQLQPTNPENIALLKERLSKLNARLGDKS